VGESNDRAVFWEKTNSNDQDAVIVHCEGATAWIIRSGGQPDRIALPGLGPSNRPRVEALNNTPQPEAAGAAGDRAVKWNLSL
jgi:hypothetical protein